MWSPNLHVSDENQIPAIHKSNRKSVGRTPLQDLSGENLLTESKNFSKARSSLTLSSCPTNLARKFPRKELSSCNTGSVVNIWVETSSKTNFTGCSVNMPAVTDLQLSSRREEHVPEENQSNPQLRINDNFIQLNKNVELSDYDGQTSIQKQTNSLEETVASSSLEVAATDLEPKENEIKNHLLIDSCQKDTLITNGQSTEDIEICEYTEAENGKDNLLQLTLSYCSTDETELSKDLNNLIPDTNICQQADVAHSFPFKSTSHAQDNLELDMASSYETNKMTGFDYNLSKISGTLPTMKADGSQLEKDKYDVIHTVPCEKHNLLVAKTDEDANTNSCAAAYDHCLSILDTIANKTFEIDPCLDVTEHQSNAQSTLAISSSFPCFKGSLNKANFTEIKEKDPNHNSLPEDVISHVAVSDIVNQSRCLPDHIDNKLIVEEDPSRNDRYIKATELNEDTSFSNNIGYREFQTFSLIEEEIFDQSDNPNTPALKDRVELYYSEPASDSLSRRCILEDFPTVSESVSCKLMSDLPDNNLNTSEENTPAPPAEVESLLQGGTDIPSKPLSFDNGKHSDYVSLLLADHQEVTPIISPSDIKNVTPGLYSSVMRKNNEPQLMAQEIPILNMRTITQMTPKVLCSPLEAGTWMTPTSTSSAATWTTPIMLLNKSLNTSWDFTKKGERNAKDNASETDSLLWNFSKESFRDASAEELVNRLEGALIVIEVLSRQLQGWQQDHKLGLFSRPSEQREKATQTCVTYSSNEEQYYHNLYVTTKARLQSQLRSNEEEDQLKQMLRDTTQLLASQKMQSESMFKYANNLYDITQKNKADLNLKMSRVRGLLADHMTLLKKMESKMQANIAQREEMRNSMEKAFLIKEAAEECLRDFELHASTVIAQLQRDLESEKLLCETVRQVYEKQLSHNEVIGKFSKRAQLVCSEMEDSQSHVKLQLSQARELMSKHWHLFEVMKKRTQSSVQEYEAMKIERDRAFLEKEEMYNQLEDIKSQSDQKTLEATRLASELGTLMEQLCKLECEVDQLKQDNSDLVEKLSDKDLSLKLLEKELDEANTRDQKIRKQNKLLADTVPRLEFDLSEAERQKRALQIQIQELEMVHTSQVAVFTESIEFLEQENSVCREQVAETESQLKTNLFALRERNLQCEAQKDAIRDLQREYDELQEELQNTKCEAREMLLKMGKDISDSSMEVSHIKSTLRDLREQMRNSLLGEPYSKSAPHTPARQLAFSSNSLVGSVLKAQWEECRSGDVDESLPDMLRELNDIVSDFTNISSQVLERKWQEIKDLKREITNLKEDLLSTRFQHSSDLRNMREEIEKLRLKNKSLDEAVCSKQQCIQQLEQIVHQQGERVLQQLSMEKEREEMFHEHNTLKRSLQMYENEAKILKDELAKNYKEAARDWIQEKLILHQDLAKLRSMLHDTENTKSEIVHRAMKHRNILEGNLARSESELQKLDNLIEKIREALLSIPEVVSSCEKLRQVMEYLD
ncbi:sperm-associated antigen 5 [Bombina bombina]|uniref:sperm-associated antigen 5 n=1 Tax=Bombina bombina TaxID=8345 RepID=UPI00235A7AC7|nr:sperm-associated antigen 5 [Bombina bombina]